MNTNYEPARASAKTERARHVCDIEELAARLIKAEQKSLSGPDPSYLRTEARIRREIDKAVEKLEKFDLTQQSLDKSIASPATEKAKKACRKAAKEFEDSLLLCAQAAKTLKETAGVLAFQLSANDAACWPSRHAVDEAVRARCIEVLGAAGSVRLPGYGSSGKLSTDISKRF